MKPIEIIKIKQIKYRRYLSIFKLFIILLNKKTNKIFREKFTILEIIK